jgi:eukaryotic-like serine/threonine-protein kinase
MWDANELQPVPPHAQGIRIPDRNKCSIAARGVLLRRNMRWARGTGRIAIGELIGEYRICDRIGVGGMGVVYEARRRSGDPVALKVLLGERLDDTRALRRFRDEAIAGHIVRHENLAATLDHGETSSGVPYLVMERVFGEPLGTRVHRDGALSLRRAVGIAQQILAGLDALHSAGVVHGDMKSDNVLVERIPDGGDHARVIDFGLAHVELVRGDVRLPDPDDELVSGTPEYMAPEVVSGHGSSTSSDLYAVGVILYEMLTGSTPFAGGSSGEIVQRHLKDRVVPPSLRRPEVPAILERIILRALEKDPARRFPSAKAFLSALEVTLPVLDDTPGRTTRQSSREAPTRDWSLHTGTSRAA